MNLSQSVTACTQFDKHELLTLANLSVRFEYIFVSWQPRNTRCAWQLYTKQHHIAQPNGRVDKKIMATNYVNSTLQFLMLKIKLQNQIAHFDFSIFADDVNTLLQLNSNLTRAIHWHVMFNGSSHKKWMWCWTCKMWFYKIIVIWQSKILTKLKVWKRL